MNRLAQESQSKGYQTDDDDLEEEEGKGKSKKDKKDKGKKKKVKKSKKKREDMSPEEREIADRKAQYLKAYDCLMFSQCEIQYGKYGSYIPLE